LNEIYAPSQIGNAGGQVATRKHFDAQNYLENFFQTPFSIPKMNEDDFPQLIKDLVKGTPESKPSGSNNVPGPDVPGPNTVDPLVETQKESFDLNDWEMNFMQKLGSFIQTPRQGKRMLNIYHLLRVRRGMKIFEFNQFIQDNNDGEYRIVLILLALNIGYPKIAKHLFPIFQNRSDTWAKFRLEITPEKK